MKKIFSTVLVLIAAGSMILSAQAKVNLNVRLNSNLAAKSLNDHADDEGFKPGGTSDTFSAAIEGEKAGVFLNLKPDLSALPLKGGEAELYGWMKFGPVRLLGGIIDGYRYADRLTADASSWERFEVIKYGVMSRKSFASSSSYNGGLDGFVETDTLHEGIKSGQVGYYVDFTGVENLKISLGTVNAAATAAYNPLDSIGAAIGYNVSDIGKFNLTVKRRGTRTNGASGDLNADRLTLGVFANITMVENLNLVIGYSGKYDIMDYDSDYAKANSLVDPKETAHAVELRAYYKLGALGLTTHNNLTFGDKYMAIYNMLNASYKLNDYFTPSLWVCNVNESGDSVADASEGNWFKIRPGITITAQKNAAIDLGIQFDMLTTEESIMRVSFPMTFRVRL